MKPIFLLSLFVFGIFGFAVAATPAQAATLAPPTYEQVLTSAEQTNLQYALDTLQRLLNEAQSRVDSATNPIVNQADISATLTNIDANLTIVDATIKVRVLTAELNGGQPENAPVVAESGNQPTLAANPSPVPPNALANPPAQNSEGSLSEQTAQAASTFGVKSLVWPIALAVVVTAIAIYYFRSRKKTKASPVTIKAPEAMNANEVTPNMRHPA